MHTRSTAKKIVCLTMAGVLILAAGALSVRAEAKDEAAAFTEIASLANRGASDSAAMERLLPQLEGFMKRYAGSRLRDDIWLLYGYVLSARQQYQDSNETLAKLLKEIPAPVIENDFVQKVTVLPKVLVQTDVVSYINTLKAENYRSSRKWNEAILHYEEAIRRLNGNAQVKEAHRQLFFDLHYNLCRTYALNGNAVQARKIIRKYLADQPDIELENRKLVDAFLAEITRRYESTRDPFQKPQTSEQIKKASSGTAGEDRPVVSQRGAVVTLTGIISDREKLAIFFGSSGSTVKRVGERINGYIIDRIEEDSVVFRNSKNNTLKRLHIGEGQIL